MAVFKKMGTRTFFKFKDGLMLTVVNMDKTSIVEVTNNEMRIETELDNHRAKDCTEEEFNTAKSIATTRISLERIES